jgi:hypothetical protein
VTSALLTASARSSLTVGGDLDSEPFKEKQVIGTVRVYSAMRLSPHHPRQEILTRRPARRIMTATAVLML